MIKKVAAFLLIVLFGLAVGIALRVVFPSYFVGDGLELPRDTPHTASELVALTRGDHPGVTVTAPTGHSIFFSATGSLNDADKAVSQAIRAAISANNGKFATIVNGASYRLSAIRSGVLGLTAGIVTALISLLVAPQRRRLASAVRGRARTGANSTTRATA